MNFSEKEKNEGLSDDDPLRSPRGPSKPQTSAFAPVFCPKAIMKSNLFSWLQGIKKTRLCLVSEVCGEKGIRTLGTQSVQRFSRPPRSTTPASLLT